MTTAVDHAVTWHDVECSAYDADLELWRELADQCSSGGHRETAQTKMRGLGEHSVRDRPGRRDYARVLELGCGTGRVALHLASHGHELTGVDSDMALVRALAARARERGLNVQANVADARAFELRRLFDLIIAPMQVVQLLGGEDGRRAMLSCAQRHLRSGGTFAAALADPLEGIPAARALLPAADVFVEDGWTFSSTPAAVREDGGATAIDRLRWHLSPAGELTESYACVRLDRITADELESEAVRIGYLAQPRRLIAADETYVDSTVVLLRAA